MRFDNLDVPRLGAKQPGGALDEVGEQSDAERGVGRAQDGDVLRGGGDAAIGQFVEAGGADQQRDSGRDCAVEALLERGGGGEIDQNVAMIVIESETRILGDGEGDRLAHPPIGREQGDADGLLVGAHE